MKVLIVGASGVLGARLYNDAIKKKWNVLGTYCSHEYEGLYHLDLRDKNSIEKIFNFFSPEAVVLAGGITDVDLCELRPGLAKEVNVKGTLSLIKKAREFGVKFVFISTDYVFNGESGPYDEEEIPSPINVYGRTKLEGELAVRHTFKDCLIVRTSQLYGLDPVGRNFTVKIIRNMRRNKKVYAADDLYCTPTYAGTLSSAVVELLEKDKRGIYNVAGTDFIDRYAYVNLIADIFRLDRSLIQKVKLKDLRLKAPRPKKAGLKIDKIKKEAGIKLLNCKDALGLFKREWD